MNGLVSRIAGGKTRINCEFDEPRGLVFFPSRAISEWRTFPLDLGDNPIHGLHNLLLSIWATGPGHAFTSTPPGTKDFIKLDNAPESRWNNKDKLRHYTKKSP